MPVNYFLLEPLFSDAVKKRLKIRLGRRGSALDSVVCHAGGEVAASMPATEYRTLTAASGRGTQTDCQNIRLHIYHNRIFL
jgi:hypothetical protein